MGWVNITPLIALGIILVFLIFCFIVALIFIYKMLIHWNKFIKKSEEEFGLFLKIIKKYNKEDKWQELINNTDWDEIN